MGSYQKEFFVCKGGFGLSASWEKMIETQTQECVGDTEKEKPDLFFKCLHSTNTSVKITEYRHCSLFQNSMYPKVFCNNIKISIYIPKHKPTKTDINTVTAHNATQAAV